MKKKDNNSIKENHNLELQPYVTLQTSNEFQESDKFVVLQHPESFFHSNLPVEKKTFIKITINNNKHYKDLPT